MRKVRTTKVGDETGEQSTGCVPVRNVRETMSHIFIDMLGEDCSMKIYYSREDCSM